MDWRERTLRTGAAAIFFALTLRIFTGTTAASFLTTPAAASAIFYLETGRIIRFYPEERETMIESPPPEKAPEKLRFSEEDTAAVFNESSMDSPNGAALLQQSLAWNLRGDSPRVLIFHTHTTESYAGGRDEFSPYHTENEAYNMVAVGDALAEILEAGGIRVIHDRQIYDTDYASAYDASLSGVQEIMEENPGIVLLLDLHRDAAEDADGNQIVTTAEVEGRESARIMAVCGSEGGGYEHPYWEENLAIALKIQSLLGRFSPELCRPTRLCNSRYNQQYYPGSLLFEIGTAGNTLEQAKLAAQYLGRAILELADGYGQDG